jgi:non-heme chloroperoxidase
MLVTGGLGREVPSDVGLYLRAHIQKSWLVEIPGTDHFVFAARPRLVNELLAQFVFATHEAR